MRGVVRRPGTALPLLRSALIPARVSPRVHHARGRRQRAAVRHAEPGRQVGRRAARTSPRTGGGSPRRAGGRAASSRGRCTAPTSCGCAPATSWRRSRGTRPTGFARTRPGWSAGRVRRRLRAGADGRPAHRRVRRRSRRLARHGGGRAAGGGARAGGRVRGAPADLRVALGPAIGPCCFEVGPRWSRRRGRRSRTRARAASCSPSPRGRADKAHVDLKPRTACCWSARACRRRSTPARSAPAAIARGSSPSAATAHATGQRWASLPRVGARGP